LTPLREVFWAAVLTDIATGLGVLPFLLTSAPARGTEGPGLNEDRWTGITTAIASGMMLSASLFALADKALRLGHAGEVVAGMVAGAGFFAVTARFVSNQTWQIGDWGVDRSLQSIVIIAMMFVHSIPEGLAIGVGYATGEIRFGLLLAIAIAVHNIPEGTAVALPLRANGASLLRCFGYAVLTSLPQPIVAVPAYLLLSVAQPVLSASLGFAGGAMIFLVVSELLPESLARCSKPEAAWGVTSGLVAMLGFTAAMGV